VDHKDETIL